MITRNDDNKNTWRHVIFISRYRRRVSSTRYRTGMVLRIRHRKFVNSSSCILLITQRLWPLRHSVILHLFNCRLVALAKIFDEVTRPQEQAFFIWCCCCEWYLLMLLLLIIFCIKSKKAFIFVIKGEHLVWCTWLKPSVQAGLIKSINTISVFRKIY